MGLIKLALAGGAAYYVVKGLKGDREKRYGCHQQNQQSQPANGTRGVSKPDEKQPDMYNNASPPSYPADQHQYQYTPTPYQTDKQITTSPHAEMVFTEPQRPYRVSSIPYDNKQAVQSTRSIPISNPSHDAALEEAMRHLNDGDQERARQVLAGAISRKY